MSTRSWPNGYVVTSTTARAPPRSSNCVRRLRQGRSPNIPQMPHSATPATPQAETDQCATDYRLTARELVAEWLATWKLQHPRSSEAEEFQRKCTSQTQPSDAILSATFEGRLMEKAPHGPEMWQESNRIVVLKFANSPAN